VVRGPDTLHSIGSDEETRQTADYREKGGDDTLQSIRSREGMRYTAEAIGSGGMVQAKNSHNAKRIGIRNAITETRHREP